MATPTLSSVPTTIDAADALTNWNPVADTLDPDIKLQGTNAVSGTWRNDLAVGFCTPGTTNVSGQHVRAWITSTLTAYMDTFANGGLEFYMSDGTNTGYWNFLGSDTYNGGWANMLIYANSTPDRGTAPTLTAVTTFGWRLNRLTAPKNIDNTWIDYLRYGDGYVVTGGTTGDRVTLPNIFTVDNTNAYGILEERDTVYYAYGKLTLGNGATTTFINWDGAVLIFSDQAVNTGLYAIIGQGSGCDITIANSVLKSAGTNAATRFDLDFDDAGLAALILRDNLIVRADTTLLKSGQTATGNIFDDCGQVTCGGADLSGGTIKNYEGTADTGALIYNETTNPSTLLEGMTFEMGTALTHAIDFGTAVTANITLTNIEFTGYGSTDDANDSTVRFLATTGSLTLTLSGCTVGGVAASAANFSVDAPVGLTVTVQFDTVPLKVTVTASDTKLPITTARVHLHKVGDTATVYFNDACDVNGEVNDSIAYPGDTATTGWAREMNVSAPDYAPKNIAGTITSAGLDIAVELDPLT